MSSTLNPLLPVLQLFEKMDSLCVLGDLSYIFLSHNLAVDELMCNQTFRNRLSEMGFRNSHTPCTGLPDAIASSRFLTCVSREESAKKLRRAFDALGELGQSVGILTGRNVDGVKNADVVFASVSFFILFLLRQFDLFDFC
jgi:hypothetical protein